MGTTVSTPQGGIEFSVVAFTLTTIEHLLRSTKTISQEGGTELLEAAVLEVELMSVRDFLTDRNEPDIDNTAYLKTLLILDELERLCKWPSDFQRIVGSNEAFDPLWYPRLYQLVIHDGFADENIRMLLQDPKALAIRLKLYRSLRSFVEADVVDQQWSATNKTTSRVKEEEPFDGRVYVQKLYDAVLSHCLCRCPHNSGFMVTNLRLNWSCSEEEYEENAVSFSLLFRNYPPLGTPIDKCRWLDTRISIPRGRTVRFHSESGDTESSKQVETLVPSVQFCDFIHRGSDAQLHFVISGGRLAYPAPLPPSRGFLTNVESIPLAALISCHQLGQKSKVLLSLLLARSVWLFYDSGWMKDWWTKDTVHFMGEYSGPVPGGIFVNEPFLRTQLVDTDNKPTHHDMLTAHPYPKILTLGIMLLEIQLGRPIQDFRRADCVDPNAINSLQAAAGDVLKNVDLWPPQDIFTDLKDTIEICITPKLIRMKLGSDQSEIRNKLYHNIVAPLRSIFKRVWGNPDTVEVPPIHPFPSTNTAATTILSSHTTPANQPGPMQVFYGPVYHGQVHHNSATFGHGSKNLGSQTAFNYGANTGYNCQRPHPEETMSEDRG